MRYNRRVAGLARHLWLGKIVIAIWLAVQIGAVARTLLPLPKPYGRSKLPWGMFREPAIESRTVFVEGTTVDGESIDVPLDELFRYTRGATDLPVYENTRVLIRGHQQAEREAFARWLSVRMWERGVNLATVRIRARYEHVRTGAVRFVELGTFDVR